MLKRCMGHIADMRIQNRLVTIFIAAVLIFFFLNYFALDLVTYVYDSELYEQSTQILNLAAVNIENELKKLEELSFMVGYDKYVQEMLAGINSADDGFSLAVEKNSLRDRLNQYIYNQKYVLAILYFDNYAGDIASGQEIISKLDKSEKEALLPQVLALNGKSLWISSVRGRPMCARLVRKSLNLSLENFGVLVIVPDVDRIVRDLTSLSDKKASGITILSGDTIIYNTNTGVPIDTKSSGFEKNSGYTITDSPDGRYFISHITARNTGWKYISAIPFNNIYSNVSKVHLGAMAAFAMVSMIILALCIKVSGTITRPIEALTDKMRSIEDVRLLGSLSGEPHKETHNEVVQLNQDFEAMLLKINRLVEENLQKQMAIQESRYKALQAQINPHFLYNTLDSINWMAKSACQKDISVMVEALGGLFRQASSKDTGIITLEEELIIVANYVAIQRVRFKDKLLFRQYADKPAMSGAVPKFSLQPLIENAIVYGLENMGSQCVIELTAELEDGRVVVQVADNGPGIDEEIINKLNSGEIRPRGSGVGLTNINERIKMFFGSQYGLTAGRSYLGGAQIVLTLPYVEKQEVLNRNV